MRKIDETRNLRSRTYTDIAGLLRCEYPDGHCSPITEPRLCFTGWFEEYKWESEATDSLELLVFPLPRTETPPQILSRTISVKRAIDNRYLPLPSALPLSAEWYIKLALVNFARPTRLSENVGSRWLACSSSSKSPFFRSSTDDALERTDIGPS